MGGKAAEVDAMVAMEAAGHWNVISVRDLVMASKPGAPGFV